MWEVIKGCGVEVGVVVVLIKVAAPHQALQDIFLDLPYALFLLLIASLVIAVEGSHVGGAVRLR